MSMERSSSATWVNGVLDMFASQGLDPARLLQGAGIDPERLNQADARIGADQVTRLWDLAVAQSDNPSLGLQRELTSRYVNFDVVGHAMLSSPNLGAGLENLARYLALISDAATFSLEPSGDNMWLVLGHTGNTLRVPRQRQEYGLLALLTLCRWLTHREVHPLAAEFVFPDPVNIEPYCKAFDCPLRFNQSATRLLFANADLAAAIPSRNASLLAVHERLMDERLNTLGGSRIGLKVSDAIARSLHRGEPRREDIATKLALTDRTLQRRLQAEHTSFQQLLDDTRRELARTYLADDRHSLTDVAERLGFLDQSNFFRASKRWFGLPPGQYRQSLHHDQLTS